MNDDTKSFLEKIQELKQKKIKVTALSLGKDIDCSPLTFKQQKDLISTVAEGTVGVLKFQKYVNDIILQNTEKEDLLITDKIPIILKLRESSIGPKVKIDDELVDITPVIKLSNTLKFPAPKPIKDVLTAELAIPTLKEENAVILAMIDLMKKDGDKDMGKNIGNIYTYEIAKFVKSIKIEDKELLFSDLSVRDRVKIVENMPLSVNKKIVEYIESVKTIENDSLRVDVGGDQKRIDIDVSFFDN